MFRRLSASLQFMCNRDINFYCSNLARIERSAQKQAKSGSGTAGWYEKWWVSFDSASYPLYLLLLDSSCVIKCKFPCRWEKYDAKGWTEKGAHKYGRLNDQSWWEKWGEHYDGRGFVLKWFAYHPVLLEFKSAFLTYHLHK